MLLKGKKDEVLRNIRKFIEANRNIFSREDYFAIKRRIHSVLRDNPSYEELKRLENSFLKYVSLLWKNSLSSFKDYDGKSDFSFLVTVPTVSSQLFEVKDLISASLITSKHLGTFNKIPVCVCLEIIDDAILGISSKDMHSVVDNSGAYSGEYYYMNDYDNDMIFTKFQVDSLLSPKEVESMLIKENISVNGNILYLGEKSVYSDILLKGKMVKVSGILVLSNANSYWINESRVLADKFNVPIKVIDCMHYYEAVGLTHNEGNRIEYHLYDIALIEAILKQKFHVTNGDSNLTSDRVGNKTIIRSMDSPNYLMADFDRNEMNIILKEDYRDIRMHYDGENVTYSVDNSYVSRNEMECLLNPITIERGK